MPQPSWQAFQKEAEIDESLAFVLMPVVYYFFAWGIYEVTAWLSWLTIPVALAVALLLVMLIAITISELSLHVKRADTATQTLRAAAQGRIELKGTLLPVGGEALTSPLYGIPCVSYDAEFTAVRGTTERVTLREKVFPAAVLLTDGVDEVFLPMDEKNRLNIEVELYRDDAPTGLLRADLREQVGGTGWRFAARKEVVVPCGKPVLVNTFYQTLTTADSYLAAEAKHLGKPPPEPKTLEDSPKETLWRDYCQRRQEASGAAHPVVVNTLLPDRDLTDISIVRERDADWRNTVKIVSMALALVPGALYLFLRLTGIIDRWDPLF
ncbi:MAG: hypothetical protein VR70_06395 [Rhodospirillaceae bacterium BRH_c57]|nr:MAG: hypothetical protein VR70_06395 [Rhodospirillaceae bacterium BRH_c57]